MLAGLSFEYLAGLAVWILVGTGSLFWLLSQRRAQRGHRGRLRAIHAGITLCLVLTLVTFLEILVAFGLDQSDSFNFSLVSKRWFARHVDPVVAQNALGFRDIRPMKKGRESKKSHIWFVGDSFTFGHGVADVADRFVDRVAADLEKRHPGQVDINFVGDCGINLAQGRNLVKTLFHEGYYADTVVYVVCLNDIEPYVDPLGERYNKLGKSTDPGFLVKNSYLINFLWCRYQQVTRPEFRSYFSDLASAYSEQPGQKLLTEIDRLKNDCEREKCDLRIVIFPFLHNLGAGYPFAAAHEIIVGHCRMKQIPVVDLRPVLEPHVAEGLTANRFDAHPNRRAHELAAEAIEAELLRDYVSTGIIRKSRE